MQAMILAAGLGTRLKPYSTFCPKPLFPVLGKPLLLRQLEQLRNHGFGPFIVNAFHLRDHFLPVREQATDVSLQFEDKILGTGGGLRLAMSKFDSGPVLVTNGDIIHSFDLSELVQRHINSGSRVSMVVHDFPRFNNVQVCRDGAVRGFGMSPSFNTKGHKMLAFTGIHIIDPDVLSEIPEGQFYDVITLYENLISSAAIEISALEAGGGFWTDIGTPVDYLSLHRDILTGLAPKSLRQMFPEVDGLRMVLTDVADEKKLSCKDWVCIGSNVRIGNNVRISRSVVWDGAVIADGANIEDRIIVA